MNEYLHVSIFVVEWRATGHWLMSPSEETPVSRRLQAIKHIIIVLSGKGGVGKSSVAAQLALSLYDSRSNARIGVLDVDLTGPSIPRMLGIDKHPVHQSSSGWVPVYADGSTARLACMSVGFLLKNRNDSVVWRGPKKNALIRQFLSDVRWGPLDYLVIDTPPGTSDEHLSLIEHLAPLHDKLGAVLVTTPQAIALLDVIKCISFTRAVSLPVLGLIENMSGFVCPCCGDVSNIFSTGGGQDLAVRENIPFLGTLPVDTQLTNLLDTTMETSAETGHIHRDFDLLFRYKQTHSYTMVQNITLSVIERLGNSS